MFQMYRSVGGNVAAPREAGQKVQDMFRDEYVELIGADATAAAPDRHRI